VTVIAPDTVVHQRYRVVRTLGRGGMGAVFEAIDTRLSARVALKQMLLSGAPLERAFEREAKLLANLRHPALPHVLDYFADPAGHFLVMEYISGSDLATLLARRNQPFPFDQALRWADALLAVLTYLHSQIPPVIHRDIKPQNIKLADDGAVILLDFGLAKGEVALQPDLGSGTMVPGYTKQYAPPEQIRGDTTDARSDLYALAATIHHLLTNVSPAAAQNRMAAILARHRDPLRAVHDLQPSVPTNVSAALAWAMKLDPADRPASAMALRAALATDHDSGLPGLTARANPRPALRITPETAAQVRELACWNAGSGLRALAWSPDGAQVAAAASGRAVHVWHIDNGALRHTFAQAGRALCVDWSSDGQSIASGGGYGDQALRLWRVKDGALAGAFEQPAQVVDLMFAPDGSTLALALSDGTLRLVRADVAQVLLEIPTPDATLWSVAFAPDGQSIAAGCSDGAIRLWRATDGALRHVLHDTDDNLWSVAFAPDGQNIAAGCSDGAVRLWRVNDGAPCFALVGHAGPVYGVAWAPDGQMIATASQDNAIRLWRAADGAPLHTLIGHTDEVRCVAFAPDGQALASCAADGTVRLWGIPA
jgi:eukaryotic-like serine/threonine-protein kinase